MLCVRFECGCDACAGGWATREGLQDTVTRAVCPRPSCGGRQLVGEAGSSWSCGGCGHQTSAAQLSAALARPVRRTVEAAQAEAGMAATRPRVMKCSYVITTLRLARMLATENTFLS